MFPFDLPGPQFLAFYAALIAAAVVLRYMALRHFEAGPPPPIGPQDPYLMACLRGGPKEVACVATVSLIDRGRLHIVDRTVQQTAAAMPGPAPKPIEQEVLRHFRAPGELFSIMKQPGVLAVASADYETELRRYNLIPDQQAQDRRRLFTWCALTGVGAVGAFKLMVALGSGRTNVGLLIVLMAVAMPILYKVGLPYRTATGSAYLAGIRTMFSGLRARADGIPAGAGSLDLLWLVSLFGVTALPTAAFPFVKHFKRNTTSSSGCGSSCGSSCSGGGCGGGGGGCGGCGG